MSHIGIKPVAEVVDLGQATLPRVAVEVVNSHEQRQMVVTIRAAVWLGEEGGNYGDHFDDNDHCCSHLIAYVRGEPAGTIRCRWFGGFARLERLTIIKRFRSFRVLRALVLKAIALCEAKGYRTVIGQAREDVVPFWRRLGGQVCGAKRETVYGDLYPMVLELPERADVFKIADVGLPAFENRIAGWEAAAVSC